MENKTRVLSEILRELDNVYAMSCKPDFKRMNNNTIIDEDKSVRWNKEQIEINHKKYDDEVKRLQTIRNKRRDEVEESVYNYIISSCKNIDRRKAIKIWQIAYSKGHSYGAYSIEQELEEIIDIVNTIMG